MTSKTTTTKQKETDLYAPVKTFLENQNYEVKGEILDCDVTAVDKEGTVVVVELKLTFNLKLLLQSVERLEVVDFVYLAIPEGDKPYKKQAKSIKKLLKRLGVGLLVVELERAKVHAVLDPVEYKPRKMKKKRGRLLKEFNELVGDPNVGGSATRSVKMTVYRQKSLELLKYLQKHGPTKASVVRDAVSIDKARDILYNNHYGWFEAQGKGVYKTTPKAEADLAKFE